jgi:hypothetical protein
MEERKLQDMQDPSRKYGKGLPVEDSELFGLVQTFERPIPSYDFAGIDESSIPEFMTVWNFLSIFRYGLLL